MFDRYFCFLLRRFKLKMEPEETSAVVKLTSGENAVVLASFQPSTNTSTTVELTVFSEGSAWRGRSEVEKDELFQLKKVLGGFSTEDRVSFRFQENLFKVSETDPGGIGPAVILLAVETQKLSQEDFPSVAQKSLEVITNKVQALISGKAKLERDMEDARTENGKLRETVETLVPEFNRKQEDMYASFLRILNAKKVGEHQKAHSSTVSDAPKAENEDFDDDDEHSSSFNEQENTDEEDFVELDPNAYPREENIGESGVVTQARVVKAAPAVPEDMDDQETVPVDL